MQFTFTTAFALSAIASVVALVRDPAVVAAESNRKGLETRDPASFEVCSSLPYLLLSLLTRLCQNGTFSKRACIPSSCDCSGFPGGLFCGGERQFLINIGITETDSLIFSDGFFGCIPDHVYQCNSDGHTTCDFGIRNSCVQCGQLSC